MELGRQLERERQLHEAFVCTGCYQASEVLSTRQQRNQLSKKMFVRGKKKKKKNQVEIINIKILNENIIKVYH